MVVRFNHPDSSGLCSGVVHFKAEEKIIVKTQHEVEAQEWLNYLRDGTDMYDSFIGHLRKEIDRGNLSLADIGTSEEELEQLRVKGCKVSAQNWLSYLRDGVDAYDFFVGRLRKEVSKGNLSLADIGTSEEELEQLRVKGMAEKKAG